LKQSQQIALAVLAIATAIVGALWWFLPIFPWWVYVILWLGLLGAGYNQMINQTAAERIVDREDK
jgi:membrane protein implicated in regulation of membrane protease activity